jgi:DNA-binding NarL/FixJ family response regulator
MFAVALVGNPAPSVSRHITAKLKLLGEPLRVDPYKPDEFLKSNSEPQLILLSLDDGEGDQNDVTLPLIEALHRQHQHAKIIAFSNECALSTVRDVIGSGVNGYVWRADLLDSFPELVRSVRSGKSVFSTEIMLGLLTS